MRVGSVHRSGIMDLSKLRPPRGAKRDRKRVGRGNASGTGTYAGKGIKGQKARSGPMPYAGFEGGQLPLVRRMARKRGFINPRAVVYEEVKVSDLGRFTAGVEVGPETLVGAGLVKHAGRPVKVLANGTIDRALTVRAHAFSAAARAKIEAAGGRVIVIGRRGRTT
jgi:large subunit ribosomal protein L15